MNLLQEIVETIAIDIDKFGSDELLTIFYNTFKTV